jgi:hypothetical protein
MNRLPAVFFGHGNPMNALADNEYTRAWRRLGEEIGKPRAIVCVSAHWYTQDTLEFVRWSIRSFTPPAVRACSNREHASMHCHRLLSTALELLAQQRHDLCITRSLRSLNRRHAICRFAILASTFLQ